ncbi:MULTISPECIES: carbohydrate ABC transporter permease [Streptomyces]|uniref:Cellobiose transport system permease protein n=1 Tax=Streptomyces demainii TaxID=588122 RepID=A0ABT9KN25_9ACTN|nr:MULTISPECIES: carbohydrate ABC transporter permease [Streptomyces]MBW8090608.1 carbohydrate ABC transporter permease [Streptomyces hygroscopicus subsp. hygroscopicus]MCO8308267.1 carbohydrate ABC transporter permease [Streptomyces sp. RKCA744]MDN3055343.1 carbohydrate ABC transporter permease [Streptomyces sp. SRF1]MDP9609828.1 cellobiose transport system permease protein [Streptomyces demainii]GLV78039.1 sugar ABC transporter permease [Streptomyces hygroscopicus subsp. hygroscopicus]
MTTTVSSASPPAAPVPAAPPPARTGRNRAGKQLHGGWITYTVLILFTLGSLFPLVWTAIAASRTNTRLAETPPPFWFGGNLFSNLDTAWNDANMGAALLNTAVVAGTIAAGTVLFSTIAGFAFAKLRFRFKNLLLTLTIGTMMVPPQLSVVPLYMVVAKLEWTDQLQAVILPTLVTAFGVFFMRQYLSQALPTELIEAARMDGASSLRIVWHIVFPAARPAMAVLGMLTFVQAWNDFFWPIIALTQTGNPTVQVALNGLGRGYIPDQSVIMAGALLGTLPLLIAFVLFGKQIVGGIMQGAVKG